MITFGHDSRVDFSGNQFWRGGNLVQNGGPSQECVLLDSDNDGISDQTEGTVDTDGDGVTETKLEGGVASEGAGITAAAFSKYISFSGPFLTIAVVLFAVSTMISWSYYGLQSWMYIFGKSKVSEIVYKLMFLVFIVIGAAGDMSSVWAFSDAMILALVFPNMIG